RPNPAAGQNARKDGRDSRLAGQCFNLKFGDGAVAPAHQEICNWKFVISKPAAVSIRQSDFSQPTVFLISELNAGQLTAECCGSVRIVLVRLVNGEAAELLGNIEQVLVAFVPRGGDLAQKNRSLVRPAELDEAGLAGVG